MLEYGERLQAFELVEDRDPVARRRSMIRSMTAGRTIEYSRKRWHDVVKRGSDARAYRVREQFLGRQGQQR